MHQRKRKIWGWGYEDQRVPEDEARRVREGFSALLGALPEPLPEPRVEEFDLPPPRLSAPAALAPIVTADAHERIVHSRGQSYADIARAFLRDAGHPPDAVARPGSADEVAALIDWAGEAGAAVIPFGGGTSVCGGVEPAVGERYPGALSIDLGRLRRVVEVDESGRSALIEGGAAGPDFEPVLKRHGLTLRHFPQSFELATLGGMIATRSGGHYATLYTHIDEFVQALEMATPAGRLETRRLPGSGAGPQPERLVCGSEGTLGIVTRAWMRLQPVPVHRAGATIRFEAFVDGVSAARAIARSGLHPANCRLVDAAEAAANRAGDGRHALLVLGFESADHPQERNLARAVEIASDHGGLAPDERGGAGGAPAAARWREAFMRMPYYRELLVPHGVIVDTFETACLWSAFEALHAGVTGRLRELMRRLTGRDGLVTCRLTHVYPDGPAPYFTFVCRSRPDAMLEHWRELKRAANEAVVGLGGTVTHHHAVGRDHRPGGYDRERSPVFASLLAGAKAAVDPAGIMNPGALIDPRSACTAL